MRRINLDWKVIAIAALVLFMGKDMLPAGLMPTGVSIPGMSVPSVNTGAIASRAGDTAGDAMTYVARWLNGELPGPPESPYDLASKRKEAPKSYVFLIGLSLILFFMVKSLDTGGGSGRSGPPMRPPGASGPPMRPPGGF